MKQPTIANKKVTRYILQRFGIHMSKRLGQNFLIDANIVQGIVDAANVQENDRVLEIGPGIGTLTQALAETGAEVTCVELDKRLPEVLAHTLDAYDNVRVIQGDILKVNIPEIMGDKPFKVVANLPYYITTPIIMALLEKHLPITDIVVMVQKEVAERICAKKGKERSVLTLAVEYYGTGEYLFTIPKEFFNPVPKIDSGFISIKFYNDRRYEKLIPENIFFKYVKAAFSNKRKNIANNLSTLGISKDEVKKKLEILGISPNERAENLKIEQFIKLAECFEEN